MVERARTTWVTPRHALGRALALLVALLVAAVASSAPAGAATTAPRPADGRYTCADGTVVGMPATGGTWRAGRVEGSGSSFVPTAYTFQLLVDGVVTTTATATKGGAPGGQTCTATGVQVDEGGHPIGVFVWTVTGSVSGS